MSLSFMPWQRFAILAGKVQREGSLRRFAAQRRRVSSRKARSLGRDELASGLGAYVVVPTGFERCNDALGPAGPVQRVFETYASGARHPFDGTFFVRQVANGQRERSR